MLRVVSRTLKYAGDGLYYFNDEPFTGIALISECDGWEKAEIEYQQGLRWGRTKEWYGPGEPMVESSFFNGVLHGRAKEWHKNGVLAEDSEYEYGIKLWEKRWNEDGSLIKEYKLKETDREYLTLERYRDLWGDQSGLAKH